MKKIFLAIGIIIFVLIAVFIARNAGLGNSPNSNSHATNTAIPNQIQSSSTQTISNQEPTESEINEDDENENNIVTTNSPTPTQPITNPTSPNPMSSMSGITMAEFTKHNTPQDCWIVYQNKVYDITSFLPRHPGGVNAIARHCGKNTFEQAFVNQHGTRKVSMMMQVTTFIGDFDVVGTMQQ